MYPWLWHIVLAHHSMSFAVSLLMCRDKEPGIEHCINESDASLLRNLAGEALDQKLNNLQVKEEKWRAPPKARGLKALEEHMHRSVMH